ncbi:MAG: hypothetical protein HS116_27220 [Planctomycetes bacterium]|nr:hypothetical protein [Planctomycetota bacterium]
MLSKYLSLFLWLSFWTVCTCAGQETLQSIVTDPLSVLKPPPQLPGGAAAAEVIELPEDWEDPRFGVYADNPSTYSGPKIDGYRMVLGGTLTRDTTLTADQSPVLVRGSLVVPAGRTLLLKEGAKLYLQPDLLAPRPLQAGAPDPTQQGMLWIYGRLLTDGLSKDRVALQGSGARNAALFLYGREASELRGADLLDVAVTQRGGSAQWLGCRFTRAEHYALARGAALFVHTTFERCGGVLATYDAGPWALLARRCLFEHGREGIVLGSNPGADALHIEQNHFVDLAGAHLRALPVQIKSPMEVLIGENWHGTSIPEQIDARIVDRRSDRKLNARLNTRPPAEAPYDEAGADVPLKALARTYQDAGASREAMLQHYARREKEMASKAQAAGDATAQNR